MIAFFLDENAGETQFPVKAFKIKVILTELTTINVGTNLLSNLDICSVKYKLIWSSIGGNSSSSKENKSFKFLASWSLNAPVNY